MNRGKKNLGARTRDKTNVNVTEKAVQNRTMQRASWGEGKSTEIRGSWTAPGREKNNTKR